ncbi:MAG: DUF2165 domain-containing protein [Pseudomonadota bacterium]
MDAAILIAQIICLAGLAGWLSFGVRDNILHPTLNETYTTEVMEMTRLKEEYPEVYAEVSHRAITDPKLQRVAFRLVVAAELAATILLWLGTAALVLALFGAVSSEVARSLGLYGATAFLAIWSAFLVFGNHFNYWFCHEGAQNTHYQMTLWGLGTLILLTQG